jgi:hypothetical protein
MSRDDDENYFECEDEEEDIVSSERRFTRSGKTYKVEKETRMASEVPVPKDYEEAITCEDAKHWEAAIEREFESLEENGTWVLTENKPPGVKQTGNKWVFKVKGKSDGSIDIFKARLVIKGFMQIKGVNYDETFAPVIGISAVRIILALGLGLGLHESKQVFQIDIATAYQNGIMEHKLYVKFPQGYKSDISKGCLLL